MKYYSYLVEHDLGLAPNPFGKYCTLTVCKPLIRKSGNLEIGDWIIGTGSKALEKISGRKYRSHLIYAMKVAEIIPLDEYWKDKRFHYKRPIINGSLVLMYGDNFYHKDNNEEWIQEDSAHSNNDGTPNNTHLEVDVGGKNAIISTHFYYFGKNAKQLPSDLRSICHKGIGQKLLPNELGDNFIKWLTTQHQPGIHGRPVNWIIYNQQKLF